MVKKKNQNKPESINKASSSFTHTFLTSYNYPQSISQKVTYILFLVGLFFEVCLSKYTHIFIDILFF